MIRFLGFWCLHFSKKIGQIKSATYFQVLTVMNSSCPKTLTWLAQTWDSHLLPAVPSRSHILWKRSRRYLPSRISFRMWYRASSCDTSSNGPSFSKKNLLKEAPEWKHPLIYSQSLASATCNEWTSEKASCELLGKKYKKNRLLRPWNPGWTGYSNGICSNLSRNIDSWNLKPSKSVHQVSWLIMWMSKNVQKKNPRKVVPPKLHQNAARNCRRNIMPIAIKSSKELEVRFFIRLDDIRVFFRLEGSQFNDGMAPSNQPPTSRFVSSNWTI